MLRTVRTAEVHWAVMSVLYWWLGNPGQLEKIAAVRLGSAVLLDLQTCVHARTAYVRTSARERMCMNTGLLTIFPRSQQTRLRSVLWAG